MTGAVDCQRDYAVNVNWIMPGQSCDLLAVSQLITEIIARELRLFGHNRLDGNLDRGTIQLTRLLLESGGHDGPITGGYPAASLARVGSLQFVGRLGGR